MTDLPRKVYCGRESLDRSNSEVACSQCVQVTRYSPKKFNPWMLSLKMLAPFIETSRQSIDDGNKFVAIVGEISASISKLLDNYRQVRDSANEQIFTSLCGMDVTRLAE